MLILAMTWAYVVLMMAVTAKPWYLGVFLFVFLAALPLTLALWMTIRKHQARAERLREAQKNTEISGDKS